MRSSRSPGPPAGDRANRSGTRRLRGTPAGSPRQRRACGTCAVGRPSNTAGLGGHVRADDRNQRTPIDHRAAPKPRHSKRSTPASRWASLRSGTSITFSHELIREAVADWLAPADRIRVHRDAVTALASGPVQQLPQAAAHASALAGVDPAFTSDAVDLSVGQRPDSSRSVGSLEAGLGRVRRSSPAQRTSACHVLPIDRQLAHADAALGAGRLTRARELYQRVATAAELAGDVVVLADAAAGLGGIWLGEHRSDDVAASVQALQHAQLEAVAPIDAEPSPSIEGASRRRSVAIRVAMSTISSGYSTRCANRAPPRIRAEALSIMIHAKLGPQFARHRLELGGRDGRCCCRVGRPSTRARSRSAGRPSRSP